MIYDSNTIILAVLGMIGILSTGVILTYAFKRNKNYNGRYQWSNTLPYREGFFGVFLENTYMTSSSIPDGFSTEQLEELMKKAKNNTTVTPGDPKLKIIW